jgi:hypothetical protein
LASDMGLGEASLAIGTSVATLDQGVSLVRTVDTPGSMRYHHWRVYGDEEMAGAPAGVWLAKAKGDPRADRGP